MKTKKCLILSLITTIFVLLMVSCPNGTSGGKVSLTPSRPTTPTTPTPSSDWKAVTGISQVKGKWEYRETFKNTEVVKGFFNDVTEIVIFVETIDFDAANTKISSTSMDSRFYSGDDLNDNWSAIKSKLKDKLGFTNAEIDDSTKTAVKTRSWEITSSYGVADFISYVQIYKNGKKIRMKVDGEYRVYNEL